MLTNTEYYQTDYEIDQKILRNAAKSRYRERKSFSGCPVRRNSLLKRTGVFIKGTYDTTPGSFTTNNRGWHSGLFRGSALSDKSGVYGMFMS